MLYPNLAGTKFDIDVLPQSPRPMVRRVLGSALKGVSVEHGISRDEPGSAAPYIATGHLLFDSVQSFQRSFARMRKKSWRTSRSTRTPNLWFRLAKSDRDLDACTVRSFPPCIAHRRWGLQHHCNMDRGATVWPRREQSAIDEP